MPRGCPEATAHRDFMARALGFSKNAWRDEEPQTPGLTGSEALAAPRTSLMALGTADKWMLGTGFVELWERLHAAEAAGRAGEPEWQALRWDLEELRVSQFAQELGTRGGVSPKKLAARLARIPAP